MGSRKMIRLPCRMDAGQVAHYSAGGGRETDGHAVNWRPRGRPRRGPALTINRAGKRFA